MAPSDPQTPLVARRSLRGRRGRAAHTVKNDQRARLMHAMAVVAAERGYEDAAIERVLERAGVSRRTLYDLFANREHLFGAVLDAAAGRLCDVARTGFSAGGVAGAVVAVLELLAAEPSLARVLVTESLAAGEAVRGRRREALRPLGELVEEALGEDGRLMIPPAGVLGGARELIDRVLDRDGAFDGELAAQVTYLIVAPYRGARPATAEAKKARRAMETVATGVTEVPRPGPAGISLTDLQQRCLAYVAENPGVNGREVAAGARVAHDAQASRLMRLLNERGLVERARRGSAYSWSITRLGIEVLESIERATEPEWLA